MRGTSNQWLAICVCWIVLAIVPTTSFAQTEESSGVIGSGDSSSLAREETFEPARGLGMGSGVRASTTGTAALAYNTANLGLVSAYHIEAFSSIITKERTWSVGTAVADSVSSRVAVGTSFRGVFGKDSRQYKGWDWRMGVGLPILKQLAVGMGVRWAKLRARTDSEGERLGPRLRGVTIDASIRATPAPWLHIAALGYNLINLDTPLAPQMVGGSVALVPIEDLEFGSDVLVDLSTFEDPKLILGGGASYAISGVAPIRLGYRRDVGRDLHQFTAALGYSGSRFGAEVALRQDVGDGDETQLFFSISYKVR